MNFADRLHNKIEQNKSMLIAGFDPRPELIPQHFHKLAEKHARTSQQYIYKLLTEFHAFCLSVLAENIAAIKPNLAFFEAFGLAGLQAYVNLCQDARAWGLPVVADAKRGDIGTTAEAYCKAFLAGEKLNNYEYADFVADAVTVNPFLGFDTLEPFLKACQEFNKGIFVLVKTSNPGSADIQGEPVNKDQNISIKVANWLAQNAEKLMGQCGYSSLGAVVGATYPEEARSLRKLMPKNIFLIPGVGTQGGSMADAKAGCGQDGKGALINVSRGLLGSFKNLNAELQELRSDLEAKLSNFTG